MRSLLLVFVLLLLVGCSVDFVEDSDTKPAYVVLHMEPHDSDELHQEAWVSLVDIVAAAEEYGFELTLAWSPSWAEWLLDNENNFMVVRAWEVKGHEMVIHHHGLSHAGWDGYSNDEDALDRPGYKGSVDDMMLLLDELTSEGYVTYTGTDEETDMPDYIIYNSDGGSPPSIEDLLSVPTIVSYGGKEVYQTTKAPYYVGKGFDVSLEDIEERGSKQSDEEFLGVVLSDEGDFDNIQAFEDLFELLDAMNKDVSSLKEISKDL